MNPREDGGQAFPVPGQGALPNGEFDHSTCGMSLRDYFAGKAVQGLLAQSMGTAGGSAPEHAAAYAYATADAMLKARQA